MYWVNLGHRLLGAVLLIQGLVANLSVLTKSVLILARSVHVNNVIVTISVFLDDWFQHLMWNIVLPVFWWRLESSWVHWINLSHRLLSTILLIQGLVTNLDVFTKSMLILAWSVHVNDIIMAISVFLNQWFLHLMWNIVLPIFGGWLETSWVHWIDLGK